jgi:hypothetical protein
MSLTKKPSPPARVLVVSSSALLAPIPPSSLPPGAGNEYEYALNAELNRAKQTEEGYVDHAEAFSGHLDTTTICPNGDGDVAAVPAVEEAQPGYSEAKSHRVRRLACPASVAAEVNPCATPH